MKWIVATGKAGWRVGSPLMEFEYADKEEMFAGVMALIDLTAFYNLFL
jgi:hypothetical protein